MYSFRRNESRDDDIWIYDRHNNRIDGDDNFP